MEASFWTTYNRARLSPRSLSAEERMQQKERFGVACLAQCLRHDCDFRASFLSNVCKISNPNALWEVEVDKYHWGDILLTNVVSVVIIECKVEDALQPEQNPWDKRGCFGQSPKGYGFLIGGKLAEAELTYVTLTASYQGKSISGDRIKCHSATWSDVLDKCGNASRWVDDLFLSLANLNYPSFQKMKIRNERVGDIRVTLACNEVLLTLAKSISVFGPRLAHEASGDGTIKSGYIGIEIRRLKDKSADKHVRQLLKPDPLNSNLAWFGYDFDELDATQSGNLAAWFYCGNPSAETNVKKKIGRSSDWELVPAAHDRRPGEKNFLHFRARPLAEKPDIERFQSMLRKIFPARDES